MIPVHYSLTSFLPSSHFSVHFISLISIMFIIGCIAQGNTL